MEELRGILKGIAVFANPFLDLPDKELLEVPLSILGLGKTDTEELETALRTDHKVNLRGQISPSTTVSELLDLINKPEDCLP